MTLFAFRRQRDIRAHLITFALALGPPRKGTRSMHDDDEISCMASDYGHHCVHDDGHTGLHVCSCGVRWAEEFPAS